MKEYILFECLECGNVDAYYGHKHDGRRCVECHGKLNAVGKYTKDEISNMFQAGEIAQGQNEMCYFG